MYQEAGPQTRHGLNEPKFQGTIIRSSRKEPIGLKLVLKVRENEM